MTKDATQVAQLKVASDRCYHGLHYIEGAPFRIPFWTIATNIDPMEGVRRLRFADDLVAAWNNRIAAATLTAQVEALTAEMDALREALGADLAAYDAVVRDCPANKTFLGERLCPKCKAGPDEGCREEIRACFSFLSNTRAALASTSEGEG